MTIKQQKNNLIKNAIRWYRDILGMNEDIILKKKKILNMKLKGKWKTDIKMGITC